MENLITKIHFLSECNEGWDPPEDTSISRLFYGNDEINIIEKSVSSHKKDEYENLVEAIEYRKKFYTDPTSTVEERKRLITQIHNLYLENENLFNHIGYQVFIDDEFDDDSSSHIINATSMMIKED